MPHGDNQVSSTTAGYLRPSTEFTTPVEDDDLDKILQAMIVGIVGLPGAMVRPRWQAVPPTEPEITVDWVAIGIVNEDPEFNVSIMHHGTGAVGESDADKTGPLPGGWDEMQRHEKLEIMASFYGPNSRKNAHMLREGIYLDQNRGMLQLQGLGLIDTAAVVNASELINERWRKRNDFRFRLYRLTKRAYPVRNLNEASGTVISDIPDKPPMAWDTDNVGNNEEH